MGEGVRAEHRYIESFLLTGTDSSDHHLPLTTLKRSRSTRWRRCLTREVSSTMWFRSWLPHRLSSKDKVRTVVDKQLNRLGESPLHLQAGVLSRWKYILVPHFTGIIIQSWKRGRDPMDLSEATSERFKAWAIRSGRHKSRTWVKSWKRLKQYFSCISFTSQIRSIVYIWERFEELS